VIRGKVNSRREAIVCLRVRGPTGIKAAVDVLIDSGFTGSLNLPSTIIAPLGLPRKTGGKALLADGTLHSFDVFIAEVEWDGAWKTMLVSAVGDEALLGIKALAGHTLRIELVTGGTVEITPWP
jgi:clan AA aspartic protease